MNWPPCRVVPRPKHSPVRPRRLELELEQLSEAFPVPPSAVSLRAPAGLRARRRRHRAPARAHSLRSARPCAKAERRRFRWGCPCMRSQPDQEILEPVSMLHASVLLQGPLLPRCQSPECRIWKRVPRLSVPEAMHSARDRTTSVFCRSPNSACRKRGFPKWSAQFSPLMACRDCR